MHWYSLRKNFFGKTDEDTAMLHLLIWNNAEGTRSLSTTDFLHFTIPIFSFLCNVDNSGAGWTSTMLCKFTWHLSSILHKKGGFWKPLMNLSFNTSLKKELNPSDWLNDQPTLGGSLITSTWQDEVPFNWPDVNNTMCLDYNLRKAEHLPQTSSSTKTTSNKLPETLGWTPEV
jgi:hypothetical protein